MAEYLHAKGDAAVQHLIDRQAILDCLIRYCRAVDRLDRDLLLSVYHEDAIDDHGAFVGSPTGFWDFVSGFHGSNQISTRHQISNHSCEIEGDVAHAETYYFYTGRNNDESLSTASGRYVDRFERRSGEWKIAARHCLTEWVSGPVEGLTALSEQRSAHHNGRASRDHSDPSYRRPLTLSARQPAA